MQYAPRHASSSGVSTALGWFSLGLGLAEILSPRLFTRMLDLDGREGLVQAFGVREIAAGVGILASKGPARAPWMWSRVGGDCLDLATVAWASGSRHNTSRGLALAALAGVTLIDAYCAYQLSQEQAPPHEPQRRVPSRNRTVVPRSGRTILPTSEIEAAGP